MDGIWHSSRRPRAAHPRVWVRPLDSVQAQPLAGTDGASFPFWSHDGRFVAFFAAGKLKRVDTSGGTPQTLADAPTGRGGTWSGDDVILFSGQPSSPILRIPASGGTVRPVTTFDAAQGTLTQYWPQFLPDGRHFLYYQRSTKAEHQGTYVTALDSSQSTRVLEIAGRAVYASGHLLFVRDGILFAQAFDDRALRTSGEPIRVADGVGYWASTFAYTAVTASASGALAHGPSVVSRPAFAGTIAAERQLDRPPRRVPTDRRACRPIKRASSCHHRCDDGAARFWLLAPARGTSSRVTSDPSSDWFPVWSHDGSGMFFGSPRLGSTTIFQKGGGSPEVVFADSVLVASLATYPNDVSQDGQFLLYQSTSRGYDLGVIPLSGDRKPIAFLSGPSNEVQGRFSPNHRWIAYASDESGKFEVYVRPFPPQSTRSTTISLAGGMQPEWQHDGKELFYISADGKLTAVPVVTDKRPSPQARHTRCLTSKSPSRPLRTQLTMWSAPTASGSSSTPSSINRRVRR